jgi:hypothetical protein
MSAEIKLLLQLVQVTTILQHLDERLMVQDIVSHHLVKVARILGFSHTFAYSRGAHSARCYRSAVRCLYCLGGNEILTAWRFMRLALSGAGPASVLQLIQKQCPGICSESQSTTAACP